MHTAIRSLYFSCLLSVLLISPVAAQKALFRGVAQQTSYNEFPTEQRGVQAVMLSNMLGTNEENWDTLYSTVYVCNDTIVQTYHGLDPSVTHMQVEYGPFSLLKFVDPERGVEFLRVPRRDNDLSGATMEDWKRVRDNVRDSAYQDYDYRMVHPRRMGTTYYAAVDESQRYPEQFAFGGFFEYLFHPRGRYQRVVAINNLGRHFTEYKYTPDQELDCGSMLQGIRLRPRDQELENLVTYQPNDQIIPPNERAEFAPLGLLDSNAYARIDVSDYRGSYLYIDLWASWCLPCRQEMPFMAELVERYRGNEQLKIVSLSLDGAIEEERWHKARRSMNMHWENWIAEEGMESQMVQDYVLRGIPVYLLIDPEGRVMLNNAPRPSNRQLTQLLDGLISGK